MAIAAVLGLALLAQGQMPVSKEIPFQAVVKVQVIVIAKLDKCRGILGMGPSNILNGVFTASTVLIGEMRPGEEFKMGIVAPSRERLPEQGEECIYFLVRSGDRWVCLNFLTKEGQAKVGDLLVKRIAVTLVASLTIKRKVASCVADYASSAIDWESRRVRFLGLAAEYENLWAKLSFTPVPLSQGADSEREWRVHNERMNRLGPYYHELIKKYRRAARYPWLPVFPDPPEPK